MVTKAGPSILIRVEQRAVEPERMSEPSPKTADLMRRIMVSPESHPSPPIANRTLSPQGTGTLSPRAVAVWEERSRGSPQPSLSGKHSCHLLQPSFRTSSGLSSPLDKRTLHHRTRTHTSAQPMGDFWEQGERNVTLTPLEIKAHPTDDVTWHQYKSILAPDGTAVPVDENRGGLRDKRAQIWIIGQPSWHAVDGFDYATRGFQKIVSENGRVTWINPNDPGFSQSASICSQTCVIL